MMNGNAFENRTGRLRRKGFTLIELMIVLTIMGILASIAVPNYQHRVIRAREAVLLDILFNFRKAIDEYYADNGKYPDKLKDLATKGYLRGVPVDPFTKKKDTWVVVSPSDSLSDTESEEEIISPINTTSAVESGNVYDVHSGSNLVGSNGVPYNEW